MSHSILETVKVDVLPWVIFTLLSLLSAMITRLFTDYRASVIDMRRALEHRVQDAKAITAKLLEDREEWLRVLVEIQKTQEAMLDAIRTGYEEPEESR